MPMVYIYAYIAKLLVISAQFLNQSLATLSCIFVVHAKTWTKVILSMEYAFVDFANLK